MDMESSSTHERYAADFIGKRDTPAATVSALLAIAAAIEHLAEVLETRDRG